MTSLPGGWIADRLIGQRRAVLYGGILIALGHFSMAVPDIATFYPRPVPDRARHGPPQGQRQRHRRPALPPDDHRRDAGFSIFYMGINLGAFIAPLVCGYLGQKVNWHFGFAAAGVGMILGLDAVRGGREVPRRGGPASGAGRVSRRRPPQLRRRAHAVGRRARASLLAIARRRRWRPAPSRSPRMQLADAAGYFLLILTLGFFGWLFLAGDWTPAERAPPLRHRRAVPRGGALLVGLRAGRLDAQPVRRSQHPHTRSRLRLPEQLVPVAELRFISCSRRCSPGSGCAWAAERAVEPDEVRHRPGSRRRRLRGPDRRGAAVRATACRSARCG